MDCDNVGKKIADYLDGLLPPEEESLVRAHIASCKGCAEAYSDLEKTVRHIKDLDEVEPPAWLTRKVMTRVKEEASKQGIWKRFFYPLHIKLPLEALVTVLVAVSALYIFKATEHDTKVAQFRPDRIEEQRSPAEDTIRQKGPETVETTKRSAAGKTEYERVPGQAVPPAELKGEIAQKPGQDNLSPVIDQKKAAEKNIPQPPPAPALQMGKKDAPADVMERSAESRSADKQKAAGGMKYAAPPDKEELAQRPAPAAPAAGIGKAASLEGRISREAVTLKLYASDIDQANDEIRKQIAKLGGRITGVETVRAKTVLTVEIDSKNFKDFFERLRTIGELREKDPPQGITEGTMKVKIEIAKKPDR